MLVFFAAKSRADDFCLVGSAETLTDFAFASSLSTSLMSIGPVRITLKGLLISVQEIVDLPVLTAKLLVWCLDV